jgi:hypothetical protein
MGRKVTLGNVPVIGFGQAEVMMPLATPTSPWAVALVTSVVSAAAGWTIEELARNVRGRRRRR